MSLDRMTDRRTEASSMFPASLRIPILLQPTETTCGPTCLHAVYSYFGERIPLSDIIQSVPSLLNGGTLAVILGLHALHRGYHAKIYTFNLNVVDPTWFNPVKQDIPVKLLRREETSRSRRQRAAIQAYREFVNHGGELEMRDLSPTILLDHFNRGQPILAGLSSTYLYQSSREDPVSNRDDDIFGDPAGHFVVLCGYDPATAIATVADPYANPFTPGPQYLVPWERLSCAILLGAMTYDANLLVLSPPSRGPTS
jgi:hypothetical protein